MPGTDRVAGCGIRPAAGGTAAMAEGGLFAEDVDEPPEGESDGDSSSEDTPGAEQTDDSSDSDDEMEKLIAEAADKVTKGDEKGRSASTGDIVASNEKLKKKKKMRWKDRRSIFINQLPYSATEEQILTHFSSCSATEDMEVRRVMNKKNGKFRGIAFIDVRTEEAQTKALALDQSEFKNAECERTINVRKAVDKGNENAKELTARQAQKRKAAETSAVNIEKLLSQAVADGSALESDFDDRSRDFLKTVPETIATAAIEDFCALDKTKVNNRCGPSSELVSQVACLTRGSEDTISIRYTLLHLSRTKPSARLH